MIEKNYKYAIDKMKFFIYDNRLIGNELIKYMDDSDFINTINHKAEKIIINSMNNSIGREEEYYEVIISLSMIALKFYDGNFWKYVEQAYPKLFETYNLQKIKGKIIDILSKYKSKDSNRYVNYPIMNAIVPFNFLSKYYEFMYDVYNVNFENDIPENLQDELKNVFRGLRRNIKEEKDDLDIAVTNKTYKLIRTTQQIIKNENYTEDLINLSSRVITNLHKSYWNFYDKDKEDIPYFNEGLEEWKSQIERKEEMDGYKERTTRERTSKWRPTLKLINNKIYLRTPIHSIPIDVDPTKIKVEIYNGDKKLYVEENAVIIEKVGCYMIESKNIEIENPIGKLTYILTDEKKEIYNSKESLYRDYIIFNDKGNEIKNKTEYSGIVIFASDTIDNEKIDIYKINEKYVLGIIPVEIGDSVILKNDIIIFDNFSSQGIIGIQNTNAKMIINNKKIPVYSKILSVMFETDKEADKFGISINDKKRKVTDMMYDEKNSNNKREITIDLRDLEQDGFYNIEIFEIASKKSIFNELFIIDKKLNWTCEKEAKDTYLIYINSAFELTDKDANRTNEFNLNTNKQTEPEIYVTINNKTKGKYILDLPIQFYRIDNNKWTEVSNYIWYYDIDNNSLLFFKNIEFDSVELTNSNEDIIRSFKINEKDKHIDISIIKNYIDEKELKLLLKENEKRIATIQILKECKYNKEKSSIIYDPEKELLEIRTNYSGKNEISLLIEDNYGKAVFKKDIKKNISITQLKGLKPLIEYKIKFFEQKKELVRINQIIYETQIKCYTYDSLINRYLQIERAFYGPEIYNLKEMRLKGTYVILDEMIDKHTYSGRVYQMREKKPFYMEYVNPVKVELITSIDRIEVNAVITVLDGEMNEDGLLLDTDNRTIFNGDNPNLQDIYEYELLLEKRKRY